MNERGPHVERPVTVGLVGLKPEGPPVQRVAERVPVRNDEAVGRLAMVVGEQMTKTHREASRTLRRAYSFFGFGVGLVVAGVAMLLWSTQ